MARPVYQPRTQASVISEDQNQRGVRAEISKLSRHVNGPTRGVRSNGRPLNAAPRLNQTGRAVGVPGGKILPDIELVPGVIYKLQHTLGRALRGWSIKDIQTGGATAGGVIDRVLGDGTSNGNAKPETDLWLKAVGYTGATLIRIKVEVY